jgi:hypothetical protein
MIEQQRELQAAVALLVEEKRRHAEAIAPMLSEIDRLAYAIIGAVVASNPALIERTPAERLSKARCTLMGAARTGGHSSLQQAAQQFDADIRSVQR